MPLTTMLGILFLDPIAVAFSILCYPFYAILVRQKSDPLKDLHPDTMIYDERLGHRITVREALLARRRTKATMKTSTKRRQSK